MQKQDANIEWPRKRREIHNHHFDSTIWNDFVFRPDDIVIASYAKSGTTWVQQIVGQVLYGPDPDLPVSEMSPWMDLRVPPKETKLPLIESQGHRRFLKTHLPVDALVFSSMARYVYVGRDARDVVWSLHNHHLNANEHWYRALNDTPALVGPPILPPVPDVVQYWDEWLARDGYPFWPFWENIRSWWQIRHLPNVLFVHYAELKKDLKSQIDRISSFLDVQMDRSRDRLILEYCSFDWMKKHSKKSLPLDGVFWDRGPETFIHRGINGRWKDALTESQIAKYEAIVRHELSPECARWLAEGGDFAP